jgi:hypothetical protein
MSELPSGETAALHDPAELPRPRLWPKPPPGHQPVPVSGREGPDEAEQVAHRRLPVAWAAIGIMIVAVVVLGLAVGRQSWVLSATGLGVGALGAGLALWSRIMEAATVGQSPKDE